MSVAVKLHSMQGTSLGIPRVNALRFGDATAVMSTCVVARPVAFSSLITAPTKRIRLRILKLAWYGCCIVPDGVLQLGLTTKMFPLGVQKLKSFTGILIKSILIANKSKRRANHAPRTDGLLQRQFVSGFIYHSFFRCGSSTRTWSVHYNRKSWLS